MSAITLSVPLLPPSTPPLQVGAVAATAPVALVAAEAELVAPPAAQPVPSPAAPGSGTAMDAAALRPDQVFMARQLAWPTPNGAALARSWRSLVQGFGAQLATRAQQARAGRVPAALLATAQDARALRQHASAPGETEPWRFTVHPSGPQAQHLLVISEEPDQPPGRRRRARAGLRLELELLDGTFVTVQVEPLPGGVVMEVCAAGSRQLERLRALQPELEAAVGRAGLAVVRWRWCDSLPPGQAHARGAPGEVANMLTLPVFRALAELALVLPLGGGDNRLA